MLRLTPLFAAFALTFLSSENGLAQSYPTRPIKLVVGQAPGGTGDIIARTIGPPLAEILKQPNVIENRGGAGGTIGAEMVLQAPHDGYTLLVGGRSTLTIGGISAEEVRYDPVRDFVPIGGVASIPIALAVSRRLPATTVAELVAYARAHPGQLTYGSAGIGSISGLAAEMFKSLAKIDIVHVPYRGAAPAVVALLSGEIDVVFTDLSLLTSPAEAGTLRLVAAAGAQRSSSAPDLATVAEQGIPAFAIESWYGIVAPAGTPPDIVATLSRAVSEAMQAPSVQQRFLQQGYEPFARTSAEFGARILADVEAYRSLHNRLGIRADP
jgi:tripartite-type tricarboxylate transporter receptor subunit TctC